MYLIPLQQLGSLERTTCYNWCTHYIGPEGAHTWFKCEPSDTGMHHNWFLYRTYKASGMTHNIAFWKDEDAAMFKLTFGL